MATFVGFAIVLLSVFSYSYAVPCYQQKTLKCHPKTGHWYDSVFCFGGWCFCVHYKRGDLLEGCFCVHYKRGDLLEGYEFPESQRSGKSCDCARDEYMSGSRYKCMKDGSYWTVHAYIGYKPPPCMAKVLGCFSVLEAVIQERGLSEEDHAICLPIEDWFDCAVPVRQGCENVVLWSMSGMISRYNNGPSGCSLELPEVFRVGVDPDKVELCWCAPYTSYHKNKKLGIYSGQLKTGMNCKCARDNLLRQPLEQQLCERNGNYPQATKAPSPTPPVVTTPTTPATAPPPVTTPAPPTPPKGPSLCSQLKKTFGQYGLYIPTCDTDGFFAPVQCYQNECYCCDKMTGRALKNYVFKKDSPEHKWANCQCARDEVMYERVGEKLTVPCMVPNGNYESCTRNLDKYDSPEFAAIDKKECNCMARYRARQCDTTRCWCANMYGHKIAQYQVPLSMGASMNCSCAREEDDFRGKGLIGQFEKSCNKYGAYEPISV